MSEPRSRPETGKIDRIKQIVRHNAYTFVDAVIVKTALEKSMEWLKDIEVEDEQSRTELSRVMSLIDTAVTIVSKWIDKTIERMAEQIVAELGGENE
jgi:hypothetical protein